MTEDAHERIEPSELRRIVLRWSRGVGFSDADAATIADVIVDADLHGVHSHGVRLLARLAPEIQRGSIDPSATPALVEDRGVTGVMDANHAFGPVACSAAVAHVCERAAVYGMTAVALRNSSHWGRPAFYSTEVARRNLVLIAGSNSALAMPLWGAAVKSVGNNPITIGIPNPVGEPWVLDISMQQAAWGKIGVYRDAGEMLPDAWGFDAAGEPTRDPAALVASGRVRPMGDHKGSGLAVMFEALTGGLAGSLNSFEISRGMADGGRQQKSQFFLALDPAAFGGAEAFGRVVSSFTQSVAGIEPAQGHDEVRLPGMGAARYRRAYASDGIPLIPTIKSALAILNQQES